MNDLNYSNIINEIQGNELIAAEILHGLAKDKANIDEEIKQAKERLDKLRNRRFRIQSASLKVLKHLDKQTPLAVMRYKCIVVVTDNDITIENNVI